MKLYHTSESLASGSRQTRSQLQSYVFTPKLLLEAFSLDPIAIGIYCLVGRLNQIHRNSVALSAADIVRYLGYQHDHPYAEPLRTRVMRSIQRLEEAGWLDVSRSPSLKNTLLCTWGKSDRLWDFTRENTNRPNNLRGVQLPTTLIDVYIGCVEPVSGRKSAAIRRYFSTPLLDLDDIGSYALQRYYASNHSTERLLHLDLVLLNSTKNPCSSAELIAQAKAGMLTTLDADGVIIAVSYRDQGHTPASSCQQSRSSIGSPSRSQPQSPQNVDMARPNEEDARLESALAAYGMDDHMIENKPIDRTTDTMYDHGGGVGVSDVPVPPAKQAESTSWFPSSKITEGHTALNPHRTITDGEWFEIAALEEKFGYKDMLIWQARAARASRYQRGVVPGYYEQCAGRDILARYQPVRKQGKRSVISADQEETNDRPITHHVPVDSPKVVPLDNERAIIVGQIEAHTRQVIVQREKLARTPIGLLRQWEQKITHAGLTARFLNPLGFAVKMMTIGNAPPPDRLLEQWAAGTVQAIGDVSTAFAREAEVIQAHCDDNLRAWRAAGVCDSRPTVPIMAARTHVARPVIAQRVVDSEQSSPASLQWLDVCADVRMRLPRPDHHILQRMQLMSCTQTVTISVDTQATYNKAAHYVNLFRVVVREHLGRLIEIRFVIRA